jgi:hypothetical protein
VIDELAYFTVTIGTEAQQQEFVRTALAARRRSRPVVENLDYAAFARRVIRAQGRRIVDGDIEELAYLFGLQREMHQAIDTAIAGLRAQGSGWADIALRLGITRQAAHQCWATTDDS